MTSGEGLKGGKGRRGKNGGGEGEQRRGDCKEEHRWERRAEEAVVVKSEEMEVAEENRRKGCLGALM